MAVLVAHEDELVADARANLIAAWFVVDASGSMAGGRWSRAQAGIRACLDQLTPTDFVGIMTFAEKVNVIDANMKKDLDASAFFRMSPTGGTKLYDGIAQMVLLSTQIHVKLSKELPVNVITYVVVLTDGEDTSSELTLEQTKRLVAQVNALRNFKMIFAGIQLDYSAGQALRSLGAVGDSDIEFRDLKSTEDIKDLFEHITVQFRVQRTQYIIASDGKQTVAASRTTSVPVGSGVAYRPSSPTRSVGYSGGGGGYGSGYGGGGGYQQSRPAVGYTPSYSTPSYSTPTYSTPTFSSPTYPKPKVQAQDDSGCCIIL